MHPAKVVATCPDCKYTREVQYSQFIKKCFTGRCKSCHGKTATLRNRATNHPWKRQKYSEKQDGDRLI